MSTNPTIDDLTTALRAARWLAPEFPGLPAPDVQVSPLRPKRVRLFLHNDLGAFEPWRAALGIDPEDVDFTELRDGELWTLEGHGDFAGVEVELVAIGAALHTYPHRSQQSGVDEAPQPGVHDGTASVHDRPRRVHGVHGTGRAGGDADG
ncbi:hypothetical protein ACQB60_30160 [Actinomycetota bacterium Odt1-20B]